jgi:hypothetical protein
MAAATSPNVLIPTLAGTTVPVIVSQTATHTFTVKYATATGGLVNSDMMIRIHVTGGSAIATIAAGTGYSSIGQGSYAVGILSGTTVLIGGQGFESARFQNASGYTVITISSAGTAEIEAYQLPRASE